jgi:tRNA uridine 5-carbamoylmethylation protein Kti12
MVAIYIIEGIPGSGKDAFSKKLEKQFKKVYSYSEEDLLFSWKHFFLPDIEKIRIKFMHRFLDYVSKLDGVVILNRFHISFAVHSPYNASVKKDYDRLIERLKKMDCKVYIGTLEEGEISRKSSHIERGKMWKRHLTRRLESSEFDTLEDHYMDEQEKVLRLAEKQGIPFKTFSMS